MSDIDQWRVPVLAIECEGQPDRESKSASAANEQADDQRGQGKDAQNAPSIMTSQMPQRLSCWTT
jgi:hypothetical protein